MLMNRYFNIGQHITTIRETNMNSGVLQCKNYWKWKHTIFTCQTHRSQYQKYNGLHKLKHYRNIA